MNTQYKAESNSTASLPAIASTTKTLASVILNSLLVSVSKITKISKTIQDLTIIILFPIQMSFKIQEKSDQAEFQ